MKRPFQRASCATIPRRGTNVARAECSVRCAVQQMLKAAVHRPVEASSTTEPKPWVHRPSDHQLAEGRRGVDRLAVDRLAGELPVWRHCCSVKAQCPCLSLRNPSCVRSKHEEGTGRPGTHSPLTHAPSVPSSGGVGGGWLGGRRFSSEAVGAKTTARSL